MTLSELRAHFPHTRDTIYMNHAATAPLSRVVMEAVNGYLGERHKTDIENFETVLPQVEETRKRLAALLGTDAARVDFAPNTSSALTILARGLDWQEGDRIAIPGCEFPANVYPFLSLEKDGVEVDFIEHREGVFSLEDVERVLTPKTRLLSLSWVQFLSGFRADIEALSELCHSRGVLLCVDAIQGLGALQLDVEAAGVDFLAGGSHKWLMGTQGLGFFYVTEALQERLRPMPGWLHGPVDWDNFFDYRLAYHDDARRFRTGTMNHLGILALRAALGLYLEVGPAWCEGQVLENARRLSKGLAEIGLERYGPNDVCSGIVTVRHPEAETVYERLREWEVIASTRNGMLRFAPAYYNSLDEIERALDVVTEIAT